VHLPARPVLRLGTLALATVLLAGCSSGELDVDGFAPGACSDVAPALEDLDQALRDYESEDLSAKRAATEFETAQDALIAASPEADQPVQEAMTALVTDLGFLRVATDNELDDSSPQEDVRKALNALAEECGGSSAPANSSY
jgi:hypothetical protein